LKPNTAKAGVCNQAILKSLNKAQKQGELLLQMLTNQYLPIKPAEGKKPNQNKTKKNNTKKKALEPIQKHCILSHLCDFCSRDLS